MRGSITRLPLSSARDVTGLLDHLEKDLVKFGFYVVSSSVPGTTGTLEVPVTAWCTVVPGNLGAIARGLLPLCDSKILKIEEAEYRLLRMEAVKICSREFDRDPHGRRAVVIHDGCISYQHFFLRKRALKYAVHMRGADVAKFLADVRQFMMTADEVVRALGPGAVQVVDFDLWIDCFHKYVKGEPE